METLRAVRCDDCPYSYRYLGDKAFTRACGHAQRHGHRVTVLAANMGETGTVYDYHSAAADQEEGGTGSVE
jgi:hypothetical protein